MNLCLLIPALVAILCGGAIFLLSPKLRSFHKFMGFTFIFEGLVSLMAGVVLPSAASFNAVAYLLYVGMLLTAPVFYYFAVRYLLRESSLQGRDFWMLQTAFAFVVIAVPVMMVIPQWDRDVFFRMMNSLPARPTTGANVLMAVDTAAFVLFLAEYLFIQVFCIINLPKYEKSLESYYSNLEGISFRLVVMVLVLMGVRFLALVAMGFLPPANWISVIYAVVFVAFYLAATLCICRIDYTAEELGRMCEAQEAQGKEPVANDYIKSRLDNLVDESFYLDPDANLISVSSQIHINSKYLAEYLRYHYGETFLAYVNRLRVERSIPLIEEDKLTMEEIAAQTGFASVSTFYRNFIKVKGYSPSKVKKS